MKSVWLLNHYATNMYYNEGGRHYWFAKNLILRGYQPTIFCANRRHNSEDYIDTAGAKHILDVKEDIPFVFIRTRAYKGNGRSRIANMVSFYRNLFPAAKKYAKEYGAPDVILASSVHPLTLVAGIKLAKRFGVPCICEVRDLWPESLVDCNYLKKDSFVARLLYRGEKWLYKKADRLIFTVEGGKEYITDKGWQDEIDLQKVFHINNGIDLDAFRSHLKEYQIEDPDLDGPAFKVIYAGAIGLANNVDRIIDTAKHIYDLGHRDIRFLIYGKGAEKARLEEHCRNNGIGNVKFKGFVEKKYIPFVLSRGNLNIVHFKPGNLRKYGSSLNKLFDYFASGRPTLANWPSLYNLVSRYNCGHVLEAGDSADFAAGVIKFYRMPAQEYADYCHNAVTAAADYDYKRLTDELVRIIDL